MSCQSSWNGGIWLAVSLLFGRAAGAHELEHQTLSFAPTRDGRQLEGQLILSPLASRLPAEVYQPDEVARRIDALIRQGLGVTMDDKSCPLWPSVRELHTETGAVPGDVIRVSCPLDRPGEEHRLVVSVRSPLGPLLVRAPSLKDGKQFVVGQLLQPGELSSVFRFRTPGPSAPDSPPASLEVGGGLSDGATATTAWRRGAPRVGALLALALVLAVVVAIRMGVPKARLRLLWRACRSPRTRHR